MLIDAIENINSKLEIEAKIIWELDLWKKEKESEFMIELGNKKLSMLEEFEESLKLKFKEKIRKMRGFEAALETLEKKLKMKLSEMQKREQKLSKYV